MANDTGQFTGLEYLEPRVLLDGTGGDGGGFLFAAGSFLSEPSNDDPLQIALDFLRDNHDQLGLTGTDLDDVVVTDQTVASHSQTTHIYLRQRHAGIEVFGGDINVAVTTDGQVLSVGNRFVPDMAGRINTLVPTISAEEAIRLAAVDSGLKPDETLTLLENMGGTARNAVYSPGGVSLDEIPAKLMYDMSDNQARLVWEVLLRLPNTVDWLNMTIDAQTGDNISQVNWTLLNDTGGVETADWSSGDTTQDGAFDFSTANSTAIGSSGYNVFPLPLENYNDGPQILTINPANAIASPFGWHDTNGFDGPEFTDTRGNNVSAQEDRTGVFGGDEGTRPDGGAALLFDFLFDPNSEPEDNINAAVTNLFYWNNILHDVHYQYGFDEASGNFQVNNYGNSGLDDDPVLADAQFGADIGLVNNATMTTPPDGMSPFMAMYEFDETTPHRDSSLDNGIIVHEYGHGVSNRLTGGPANANALTSIQSAGMGEGWSDWWTLMFTQMPSDDKFDPYPIGTWAIGESSNGDGIRRFPYSFDMNINPLTYGAFNGGFPNNEVHNSGEIWASALWDMNWLLIDKHGYDPDLYNGTSGNNLALQLVMDGLKLQPSNPTFLDGRDAILAADQTWTGGQNQLEIWIAFARRGMGVSASDGDRDATNVTEAFNIPVDSHGTVLFDAVTYAVGDTVTVTAQDGDLLGQGSATVQIVSDNGDVETMTLPETGPAIFSMTITTALPDALAVENGVLEVDEGDTIVVTYNDVDDGTGNPAAVTDSAFFPGTASISGIKFDDLNADGIKDPDEPALADWTVFLDANADGVLDPSEATDITDTNGAYSFTALLADDYRVTEVLQADWIQSLPGDPDPFYAITLSRGEVATDIDFGNYQLTEIHGVKFNDENGNGIFDQGGFSEFFGEIELAELGPIMLVGNDDQSTGKLNFGFTFDFFGQQYEQFYINNNGNITFDAPLSAYRPLDFPRFVPMLAPFWADVDTRPSESGKVRLSQGVSPRGNPFMQIDWPQVSHFDQSIERFNDFTLYIEDDPAGDIVAFVYGEMEWTSGDLPLGVDGFGGVGAQIGADAGNGLSFLSLGRPDTPEELLEFTNTSFSFRFDLLGSPDIESGLPGVTTYLDLDNNQILDPLEPFTVTLDDDPTTTDIDETGQFSFTGLVPGTFTVREIVPDGFVQTFPLGTDELDPFNDSHVVTLVSGQIIEDINFGNLQLGSIAGQKFEDLNGNGVFDLGEPGLDGWVIFIDEDDNDELDPSEPFETTDVDGNYAFSDMPFGNYLLREQLQAGWVQTTPDTSFLVNLGFAEDRTDVDFGNFQLVEIQGSKFQDNNANGVWDVGEPLLENWTMFIDENGNNIFDPLEVSTLTDGGGNYAFANLGPGSYTISEVVEDGFVQTSPQFFGDLLGDNEVPSVTTDGSGLVRAALDPTNNEVSITVEFSNLTGTTTALHVYRGDETENGDFLYDLDDLFGMSPGFGSSVTGSFIIDSDDLVDLRTGNLYVNLITTEFPNGELRAQLIPGGFYVVTPTSGQTVVARDFGNAPLTEVQTGTGARHVISVIQNDGNEGRINLKNGSGSVFVLGANIVQQAHNRGVTITGDNARFHALNVDQSTLQTTVHLSIKGSRQMVNITNMDFVGSVGKINGRNARLLGDVNVSGMARRVQFGEVVGPSTFSTGLWDGRKAVNIKIGDAYDFSVDSTMPIRTFNANQTTNTDNVADTIHAPWMRSLRVKKSFSNNITLTSTAVKRSLRRAKIGQWLNGASVWTARDIGSMSVGGVRDTVVTSGVRPDFVTADASMLPDSVDDFDQRQSTIHNFTVRGIKDEPFAMINSSVAAWSIRRVRVDLVQTDNAVTHGFAAHSISRYFRQRSLGFSPTSRKLNGPVDLDTVDQYKLKLV